MKSKLTAKIFYLLLAAAIFSTAAFAQRSELGGRWNLTELKSSGETININLTGRDGEKLGIDFREKKRFGLITPCNAAGGSFTADTGGNFKAGDMLSTKMFCGDERIKVEIAMTGAMQAATKYSIENGYLILRDETTANVLKFSRSGKATPSDAKEMTLYIAPKQVNCTTVAPMKCFRAKEKSNDEWRLFYDRIEGFDFQKGYYYILKVRRTKIENPPKATSSLRWELIEVMKRTKKFAKA